MATYTKPPKESFKPLHDTSIKIRTDRSRRQCYRRNGKKIRKISPKTYAELAEQPITPEEIHALYKKEGAIRPRAATV